MKDQSIEKSNHVNEHLANERTFLAWIRTSIALMGFGFVIVKFALFLRQISLFMDLKHLGSQASSSVVGVIMIILGVVIALMSFVQYKTHEKQLKNNSYAPSSSLLLFITLIIMIGGIILTIYLIPVL